MSMSPLGDNHLEIMPGSPQAAMAPRRALLPSEPYLDFNALTKQINDIAPEARRLLNTLNDRATELKVTIDRVNDLLSAQNRANLAATLANTRGMLEEDRPKIKSTLTHLRYGDGKTGTASRGFPEDFSGREQERWTTWTP